jgi:hypothetical protein
MLGVQTLGEEYTDIWQHPSRSRSLRIRTALVLLPTLPAYALTRWGSRLSSHSRLAEALRLLPNALEIATEVNLAIFYLRGTYYDLTKRILRIRQVRSYHLKILPKNSFQVLRGGTTSRSQQSNQTHTSDHPPMPS